MSVLTITATPFHDLRQAAERFAATGFPDVHNLQGGTVARKQEGAVRRLSDTGHRTAWFSRRER